MPDPPADAVHRHHSAAGTRFGKFGSCPLELGPCGPELENEWMGHGGSVSSGPLVQLVLDPINDYSTDEIKWHRFVNCMDK